MTPRTTRDLLTSGREAFGTLENDRSKDGTLDLNNFPDVSFSLRTQLPPIRPRVDLNGNKSAVRAPGVVSGSV